MKVFIHPLRAIAEAIGMSPRATFRWIKWHGLPVFHTPSGKVATSVGLLEQWARERMEAEKAIPRNGAQNGQGYQAAKKLVVRLRVVKGETEAIMPREAKQGLSPASSGTESPAAERLAPELAPGPERPPCEE